MRYTEQADNGAEINILSETTERYGYDCLFFFVSFLPTEKETLKFENTIAK